MEVPVFSQPEPSSRISIQPEIVPMQDGTGSGFSNPAFDQWTNWTLKLSRSGTKMTGFIPAVDTTVPFTKITAASVRVAVACG